MTADRITVAELQELLAAGQPVSLLDVRSPSDVDPANDDVDRQGSPPVGLNSQLPGSRR